MMTQLPFFTTLKERGLIKISGIKSKDFLQALITNDINLLNSKDCIYACLLSPQGKFLFDFFITQDNENNLLLECEGKERSLNLAKTLNMYKLHLDIDISVNENTKIYSIFGLDKYGYKDPRHKDMGYRSFIKPRNIDEKSFDEWDKHRISLTIPDGSRDLIVNKSTMDEGNMNRLNAVSYDKGCYIGQEITARMHYRGLGKKHLHTIHKSNLNIDEFPEKSEPIYNKKTIIGEMRSSNGDIGIALIKDEWATKLL